MTFLSKLRGIFGTSDEATRQKIEEQANGGVIQPQDIPKDLTSDGASKRIAEFLRSSTPSEETFATSQPPVRSIEKKYIKTIDDVFRHVQFFGSDRIKAERLIDISTHRYFSILQPETKSLVRHALSSTIQNIKTMSERGFKIINYEIQLLEKPTDAEGMPLQVDEQGISNRIGELLLSIGDLKTVGYRVLIERPHYLAKIYGLGQPESSKYSSILERDFYQITREMLSQPLPKETATQILATAATYTTSRITQQEPSSDVAKKTKTSRTSDYGRSQSRDGIIIEAELKYALEFCTKLGKQSLPHAKEYLSRVGSVLITKDNLTQTEVELNVTMLRMVADMYNEQDSSQANKNIQDTLELMAIQAYTAATQDDKSFGDGIYNSTLSRGSETTMEQSFRMDSNSRYPTQHAKLAALVLTIAERKNLHKVTEEILWSRNKYDDAIAWAIKHKRHTAAAQMYERRNQFIPAAEMYLNAQNYEAAANALDSGEKHTEAALLRKKYRIIPSVKPQN